VAIDDQQRVLLIRQYRHPAGQHCGNCPQACDQPGEQPLDTGRRELAEETGLEAALWNTLVDLRPSPGMSTEVCRLPSRGRIHCGCTPPDTRPATTDL
jgi:8-oxo-dGTP pyrophosphatase MutT (NUDIX family)